MMLARLQALPEDRIMGVETGGCPHTAIREDASINLQAIAAMRERHPDLDIVFIESGGDNLAATFSPDLADLTIYVISVCQGEEIPRKGGPGITRSDFLVINKSDLAPYVNVNLDVMERDAAPDARGAAVRLHRSVAREGPRRGDRLHCREWRAARMRHSRRPDQARPAAPSLLRLLSAERRGILRRKPEDRDEHRPNSQGNPHQPSLLRGARRPRLRLPLDRAAQHARGGGEPLLAGRQRGRLRNS